LADLAAKYNEEGIIALAGWGKDNSLTDENRRAWSEIRRQAELRELQS
jgi:hypothetical protein